MTAHAAQQIAEAGTILRTTVGSCLHGLALEGTDDRDDDYDAINRFLVEEYIQAWAPENAGSLCEGACGDAW